MNGINAWNPTDTIKACADADICEMHSDRLLNERFPLAMEQVTDIHIFKINVNLVFCSDINRSNWSDPFASNQIQFWIDFDKNIPTLESIRMGNI